MSGVVWGEQWPDEERGRQGAGFRPTPTPCRHPLPLHAAPPVNFNSQEGQWMESAVLCVSRDMHVRLC